MMLLSSFDQPTSWSQVGRSERGDKKGVIKQQRETNSRPWTAAFGHLMSLKHWEGWWWVVSCG